MTVDKKPAGAKASSSDGGKKQQTGAAKPPKATKHLKATAKGTGSTKVAKHGLKFLAPPLMCDDSDSD